MMNFIKRNICCCIFKNENKITILKDATNNIPEFSLNGLNTIAKIVDVYDGDTCKAVFYMNKKLTKMTIRMNGYDTPEIRTNNNIERVYGFASKRIVERMILNKLVHIRCYKWEKYGRLLADIYIKTPKEVICLNDWIVSNNLAVKYDGKKKSNFIAHLGDNITMEDIINNYNIPYTEDMDKCIISI